MMHDEEVREGERALDAGLREDGQRVPHRGQPISRVCPLCKRAPRVRCPAMAAPAAEACPAAPDSMSETVVKRDVFSVVVDGENLSASVELALVEGIGPVLRLGGVTCNLEGDSPGEYLMTPIPGGAT